MVEKLFKPSGPQFPQLKNGYDDNNDRICFRVLLGKYPN